MREISPNHSKGAEVWRDSHFFSRAAHRALERPLVGDGRLLLRHPRPASARAT